MKKDSCNPHNFTISIRNELGHIYPVQASAKAYAETLGFEKKACYQIELLIEEILSNVIKFDFMPEQKEEINLSFMKTPTGMSVSIHSNCIPLDTNKIKSFESTKKKDILKNNASGLGSLIINKAADIITYTNKGREGQFIYFEKNLPQNALVRKNIFDENTSKPEPKSEFSFYTRLLKPEESLLISQLAYYAYGVSYIYDKIYYPENVRKLNEQGEMLSVVAVNKENEDIIGHVAAMKDELSGMTELAVAFVNPQYRGGGCLQTISEFLIDLLKKKNTDGVIVHAVTTHPYSQKAAYKLGLRASALFISSLTPLLMNEIKDDDQERESLLNMYLPLKVRKPMPIYAPIHHYEIISLLYENIGQPVKIISEPPQHKPETELADIEVSADSYSCSHIYINRYAKNITAIITKTLKSICVNRVESIYLYLPLDCPGTVKYCAEFESLQFFFGGVVQKKNRTDYLMLQYLNNQIYKYKNVNVFSDISGKLLEYIQKHDPNQNI